LPSNADVAAGKLGESVRKKNRALELLVCRLPGRGI
jgi:hypothetical protein